VRSLFVLLCLVVLAPALVAHDIPSDITVQAFVKPQGTSLKLVVRVPLKAMRDVTFPLRGPGFLDVAKADQFLGDAAVLWIAGSVEIYEGDVRLGAPRLGAVRVSLPSDRSFDSYDHALEHVSGPRLSGETEIAWDQAMMDVLFEYPIAADTSRFSVRPAFARLGVRVVTGLRFLPPDGAVRAFEFTGDPGLVRLDPRWHQAALRFVRLGFIHILSGADHLLFLLCLIIPFRRIKPLIVVVTAFTAAHSLTLIAAASSLGPDGLWFPPLIETLIAASIVYMALENIVVSASSSESGAARLGQARWAMAFGFGLVHGFGFSFALRESLQFAGSHLLTSLLSFNLGVELGQLAVVVVMIPALTLLFRFVVAERIGTIILSALIAHSAWHWTDERWGRLRQFAWPALDLASIAVLVRLSIVLVAAAAVGWFVFGVLAQRASRARILDERRERDA
jgi:HupE / UreJ protein